MYLHVIPHTNRDTISLYYYYCKFNEEKKIKKDIITSTTSFYKLKCVFHVIYLLTWILI